MKSVVAVLALVLVSQKDVAPCERWALIFVRDIFRKRNDTGQRNFETGGPYRNIWIDIDDLDFATENRFYRILPGPQTEW
mmetsp:Transcript_58704/g.164721  ORF Transcript_58704/g.164721 Transcript_58704/m.164721 type:complete len:80 (+) Transcript_58704:363-602(+)